MKRYRFIGILTDYERLNCSYCGNPAYKGFFASVENPDFKLVGHTASNSQCAYGFLNQIEQPREITYHITRTGNIIFDYITIL